MSGTEILAFGGPAGDAFAAAAGIAAALILLVGPILLRFQRQRHQFLLTRAALERGVTQLPSGPPAWLQSARTGVILLTLGFCLFVCGIVSLAMSGGAKIPDRAMATTQPAMMELRDDAGPPPMNDGPGGPGGGMERGPRDRGPMGHMGSHAFDGGRMDDRPMIRPPVQDPVVERWHQAQAERAIGLTALASGFILSVMGLSRLLFSRVERRYEPIVDDTPVK